jgi:nitroreductase
MGYFELISSRRSVRAFTQEGVSADALGQIVSAANRAPSAGNLQAYQIVVVRQAERRRRLAQAALGQEFVAEAPLTLVFLTHPARSAVRYGTRGERLYALQDATIAATYAQLAAHALGLSSVWVGAFDEPSVLRAVEAPPGLGASSLLVIGHGAEVPPATSRRPLSDLVHDETVRRL